MQKSYQEFGGQQKKLSLSYRKEKSLNDKYNTVIDKINNGDLNEFKLKTNGKSMEVVKVTDFNNIELKTPGTSSNRTYTVFFLTDWQKLAKSIYYNRVF